MKRIAFACAVGLMGLLVLGCDEEAGTGPGGTQIEIVKGDGFKPNLPSVPTITKPNVPETYGDGSYSVYGARKNMNKTIETAVTFTVYIAKIYEKPECAEGKTCFTAMPHLWLADQANETLDRRLLRLVGYAKSFKEMEDAKEVAESGKEPEPLPEGVFLPPVVWDWQSGHKYRIKGRFTRRSGEGFMASDGILEYTEHECLDCPPPEEEDDKKKK